jgi:hypothetical protein
MLMRRVVRDIEGEKRVPVAAVPAVMVCGHVSRPRCSVDVVI